MAVEYSHSLVSIPHNVSSDEGNPQRFNEMKNKKCMGNDLSNKREGFRNEELTT